MKEYIKKSIPDFFMSLIMAASLSVTICSGFYLEGSIGENPVWMFAVAALTLAAAFVFAGKRILVICGLAIFVTICGAAVIYGRSVNLLENETENKIFIFFTVTVITSVVTFLLSRSRAGLIILGIAGTEVHAFAAFLGYPTYVWCIISFAVCALLLYLYRNYLCALMQARLGNINIGHFMLQSLIGAVTCAAAAALIFAVVIKPLNPPTMRLKLLTALEKMEIINVLGISDLTLITNPDIRTDLDPDRDEMSDENNNGNSEEQSDASESPTESESESVTLPSPEAETMASPVTYSTPANYLVLKIIIAVILAAAVLLLFRFFYKKWWRKKVREMSSCGCAVNYYLYFLKRLQRAGIKKAPQQSLSEYVKTNETKLRVFTSHGCDLTYLTGLYERVIYCGGIINSTEIESFEKGYDGFHKALKKTVGPLKYYLTIFRY